MKTLGTAATLAASLALAAASAAHAQTMTARASSLNFNTVFGGGANVIVDSGLETQNTLDATDLVQLPYLGGLSGYIAGDRTRPFTASVDLLTEHQYTVTGPLDSFSRLVASGRTVTSVATGGEGAAYLESSSPGNSLELRFTMQGATAVRFRGSVAFTGGGFSQSSITLQRFDGVTWAYVFWSQTDIPKGAGAFDIGLTLAPGEYRLIGEANGRAILPSGTSGNTNTWSFDLVVCSPADLDCDGSVNAADLAILLGAWGKCSGCAADIDGDGVVGGSDLAALLTSWN